MLLASNSTFQFISQTNGYTCSVVQNKQTSLIEGLDSVDEMIQICGYEEVQVECILDDEMFYIF